MMDTDVEYFEWPLRPPGGQLAAPTSPGVLALHRLSGIAVVVDSERSQHGNKQLAAARLADLLETTRMGTLSEIRCVVDAAGAGLFWTHERLVAEIRERWDRHAELQQRVVDLETTGEGWKQRCETAESDLAEVLQEDGDPTDLEQRLRQWSQDRLSRDLVGAGNPASGLLVEAADEIRDLNRAIAVLRRRENTAPPEVPT